MFVPPLASWFVATLSNHWHLSSNDDPIALFLHLHIFSKLLSGEHHCCEETVVAQPPSSLSRSSLPLSLRYLWLCVMLRLISIFKEMENVGRTKMLR